MFGGALLPALLTLSLAGCGEVASHPGETFDAGPVFTSKTQTVTHTFRVRNTTGVAVHIVDESHSCLCTKVDVEKGALLAPGAEIPLTLTVSTLSAHPDQTVECSLSTDHPTMRDWTYQLTLHPYPDAIIRPTRIDLGPLLESEKIGGPSSREPSAYLELFGEFVDRPCPKLNLSQLNGARARIGEATGRVTLGSGVAKVRYPIFIEPPDQCDVGRHEGSLSLCGEGLSPLSASIAWEKIGALSVAPAQLYFGLLPPGGSSDSLQLLVRERAGRSFRIISVASTSKGVTARMVDAPNAASSHRIVAFYEAPVVSRDRAATGRLLIKTDLDEGVLVSVPYSALHLPSDRRPKKDSQDETVTRRGG